MNNRKCVWMLNHHANYGLRHHELAKEFVKYGYQVVIIASSYLKEAGYLYKENCHIELVEENIAFAWLHTAPAYSGNGIGRVCNMLSYVSMVKRNAKLIKSRFGEPSCVIGSSVHPLAWEAAWWVARKYNAKFICEVRDFWPLSITEILGVSSLNPAVPFFSLVERRAYSRSAAIITTMPYGYKYICEELGYPRAKVNWIPNGIHLSEAAGSVTIPDELDDFLSSHWCCIYTGSFVKSECIDFMLDAFAELKGKEIYFAIVGSGHEQESIEKKIVELSLEHVRVFPRIEKKQVMAALETLSVYRFGLSLNKLNDYLLSETPVIFACDAPNVVQETENISIPYGDPRQMADEILRVKDMDEEIYARVGKSGRSVIESTFDYELLAKKYLCIIEQT